jgi:hypothetical protein
VLTVELLYFDGCPSHRALLPRIHEMLEQAGVDTDLHLRRIDTLEAAERERFLGSPTLRVDGRDVDPGAGVRTDYGLKCRLYETSNGLRGTPPDAWILDALAAGAEATR